MKKKPIKKGRPRIEIDWKEFDKLCVFQCTLKEMADWFNCSEDTIEKRCKENKKMLFTDYFKKKSVSGRISLRRTQFKVANDGNVTMLIWLGKQYLGQKDKLEQEISTPDGKFIKAKLTIVDVEKLLKERGIPIPQIDNEDINE